MLISKLGQWLGKKARRQNNVCTYGGDEYEYKQIKNMYEQFLAIWTLFLFVVKNIKNIFFCFQCLQPSHKYISALASF